MHILDVLTCGAIVLLILIIIFLVIRWAACGRFTAMHMILLPIIYFVIFLMIVFIALGLTKSVFNCQYLWILAFIVPFVILCFIVRDFTCLQFKE